jgi:hypothetical protein
MVLTMEDAANFIKKKENNSDCVNEKREKLIKDYKSVKNGTFR